MTKILPLFYSLLPVIKNRGLLCLAVVSMSLQAGQQHLIERSGDSCSEDPNCFNRLHPGVSMVARVNSGDLVTFQTRLDGFPKTGPITSTVHPLSGPVHIAGAKAGDAVAVTVVDIKPYNNIGVTVITDNGLLADLFPGPPREVIWDLTEEGATSEALPDVRIPNASFAGVITTLPGIKEVRRYAQREKELVAAGGSVLLLPEPINSAPANICGPDARESHLCLRTLPPREHGGNMDIRYQGVGTTIYIPCEIDGCGLAVGDVHFAQGDGEVAGTAIEIGADVTLKVELLDGSRSFLKGPHYEGPGTALGQVPEHFYATTGLPVKAKDEVPPFMGYLKSPVVNDLEVLPNNLMLAARNALVEMIRYLTEQRGLTREQAYIVASVAVDLRIGQVVDEGHVIVTAILPLDIFINENR